MPKKTTAKKVNKVAKKEAPVVNLDEIETKPKVEEPEEAEGVAKEIDPDLVESMFEEPVAELEEELDEFSDPLLATEEEEAESEW